MRYEIGAMPAGAPFRGTDGSMIIMRVEADNAARPVLLVTRWSKVTRGIAYKEADPEQEAFAAEVVAILNGEAGATAALRAIVARIQGVFDDPDLVAFGALSTDIAADVLAIATAGLPEETDP